MGTLNPPRTPKSFQDAGKRERKKDGGKEERGVKTIIIHSPQVFPRDVCWWNLSTLSHLHTYMHTPTNKHTCNSHMLSYARVTFALIITTTSHMYIKLSVVLEHALPHSMCMTVLVGDKDFKITKSIF